MALPLPNLDDRRWADLVDEARALVPRNAPQWTDHNVHDPGITLVELFAWIAEQGLFRLNQVPDRHRLKFLRLIGFSPRPPRAARTLIALSPAGGASSLAVPAGALFEGGSPPVTFRTRRAVEAQPVALHAVLVDRGDGVRRDCTAELRDSDQLLPFGPATRHGAALYLGFEGATPGLPLTIGVEVTGPRGDDEERAHLVRETEAARSECTPQPSWPCPDPPPATPTEGLLPHHSARLAWEVLSGTAPEAWTALQPVTGADAPPPGGLRDDTRAFTLDGGLELNLPASAVAGVLGPVATALHYVRARLLAGAWDAPPALTALAVNAAWADQCRPLWREFTIAASLPPPASPPAGGEETRLRLTLDAANVVTALTFEPAEADVPPVRVFDYVAPDPVLQQPGRLVIDQDVLARGHGFPEQQVMLPAAPLVARSVRVHTHDGAAWQPWQTRADLDASRRTDFHAALDPVQGRLLFGDGERGRVLPPGAPVFAAADVTAAEAGNVAAGTIVNAAPGALSSAWLSSPSAIAVAQPRPAKGGAARERIGDAARRAAETLLAHERLVDLAEARHRSTLDQLAPAAVRAAREPRRAATLLDYERLALEVPGTRVARARAWAGHHPAWPCPGVAGLVTVVVVPDMPVRRPAPSAGLLAAVRAYLDRRRTVGTRVEVVAPRYVVVSVAARVRKRRLADAARVRHEVRAALNAFLDPRTGGPAGRGWPFGRDVFRSEVLQVIDEVEGVDYVEELTLRAGEGTPRCGNLEVCPARLVAPGAHQVEVR